MSKKEGSKFYQTEEFKELNRRWLEKLKRVGFDDIETPNGSLKNKNNRTQAYQQQETLIRISSALTAYVDDLRIKLRPIEKKILDLHGKGTRQIDISRMTGKSCVTIWKTVKKHLPIALGLYSQDEVNLLHESVETSFED